MCLSRNFSTYQILNRGKSMIFPSTIKYEVKKFFIKN
jgi:hypothetical protein